MIENKLTDIELKILLRSVLRLENINDIISEAEKIFPEKLKSLEDILEYTRRFLVTYKGFKVFINGIGDLSKNSVYITIDFRIDKKWWHTFINPTKKIVLDLKGICKTEIEELSFSEIESTVHSPSRFSPESFKAVYYYQSYAFNSKWKEGMELSPLIIAPSENEKYYFVEFLFNANCYYRADKKTILKSDWLEHIKDINTYINKQAEELLKYGFK